MKTAQGAWIAALAMAAVSALSNWLVEYPINGWLTYGGLTYPVTFLVNELTNRTYGLHTTRRVVCAGFFGALAVSAYTSPWRITLAFAAAYMSAQLLDASLFSRLRQGPSWWVAPAVASALASGLDTAIFFGVAFWGDDPAWWRHALGDYAAKLVVDVGMLAPFRFWMRFCRGPFAAPFPA